MIKIIPTNESKTIPVIFNIFYIIYLMCKYDTILRNIFNVCKLHNDFLYISQMNDENTTNKYDFYFDNLIPGQSIDCVIIGFENEELQVLVLKWKGTNSWSLPGGFIQLNEDMDTAAVRILKSRTGLSNIFLEQFYTFGNKDRRNEIELMAGLKIIDMNGITKFFYFR